MKIAKRTLAIVMAMLMIVSTLAVAASAAGTLQAQIDAAHDGDVIVVNVKNAVETITINKKNQGEFAEDAICFYRPLPLRKLDTSDLFVFMKNCFSVSDWVLLLTMAGGIYRSRYDDAVHHKTPHGFCTQKR